MHPTLLHLGRFILPTFGVLAAAGLVAALSLSLRTAALVRLSPEAVWDAGLFSILSALVSSRLLLVLANFQSFLHYPLIILALPTLNASGILLTLFATLLYLRIKRLPLLATLDAWAPCATLTWAFIALGHLAEGSDPGLPTRLPWKILSPTGGAYLHPVALYAALSAALITLVLLRYLRRHPQPGRPAALALAASGIAQFLITFLRHPSLDATILDSIQWVSLLMVVAACVIYIQTVPIHIETEAPTQAPTENQEHHAL
jgi:phosphatidylglycerol---prolipoprotein diacylglyceryl transferase